MFTKKLLSDATQKILIFLQLGNDILPDHRLSFVLFKQASEPFYLLDPISILRVWTCSHGVVILRYFLGDVVMLMMILLPWLQLVSYWWCSRSSEFCPVYILICFCFDFFWLNFLSHLMPVVQLNVSCDYPYNLYVLYFSRIAIAHQVIVVDRWIPISQGDFP